MGVIGLFKLVLDQNEAVVPQSLLEK